MENVKAKVVQKILYELTHILIKLLLKGTVFTPLYIYALPINCIL